MARKRHRHSDGIADFLKPRQHDLALRRQAGEHDDEFVAADADDHVGLADAGPHPVSHGAQQLVAGMMPEAVVDHLEIIEIEEGERHPLPLCAGLLQGGCYPCIEQNTIGQAGQRIVMRHELDALLRLLALDGNTGQMRGHRDQFVVFFGRQSDLVGIQREGSQHLPLIGADRRRPAGPVAILGDKRDIVGP